MFKDILLEQIRRRLNLCVGEVMQMRMAALKEIGAEDPARLVSEIIKEIADGEILSAHFTRAEAHNCIRLLDYLGNNMSGESAQEALDMIDHMKNNNEYNSEV